MEYMYMCLVIVHICPVTVIHTISSMIWQHTPWVTGRMGGAQGTHTASGPAGFEQVAAGKSRDGMLEIGSEYPHSLPPSPLQIWSGMLGRGKVNTHTPSLPPSLLLHLTLLPHGPDSGSDLLLSHAP